MRFPLLLPCPPGEIPATRPVARQAVPSSAPPGDFVMAHTLPPLPYDFAALEPHVDAQTMQIHHGKHHQAYVTNLNAALEKAPELQNQPLEQLLANLKGAPEAVRGPIRNN